MKKLIVAIEELSKEITWFIEELEDNFESPVLGKKMQHFRKRLKECISYVPEEMGKTVIDHSDNAATVTELQLGCHRALASLETVTVQTNVYDVIDVLRSAYSSITRGLPGQDIDLSDFYDPDDEMEVRRISKIISTPFKDEWD